MFVLSCRTPHSPFICGAHHGGRSAADNGDFTTRIAEWQGPRRSRNTMTFIHYHQTTPEFPPLPLIIALVEFGRWVRHLSIVSKYYGWHRSFPQRPPMIFRSQAMAFLFTRAVPHFQLTSLQAFCLFSLLLNGSPIRLSLVSALRSVTVQTD